MAVTAKFVADFSDFHKGVAEADVKLASFGASTSKAGAQLGTLATTATANVLPFNTLRSSLQQFDGALAAAGVHLGPEIRALGELGDVAGKTSREVGLLGTAGLAFGAAMGGWKIGRMVAEFFGLDQVIANATAKLMGYGDVVTQIAGAKQDSINLAISRGAEAMKLGTTETERYTAAIQFNAKWVKDRAGVVKAAAEEEKGIVTARAAWLKQALAEEEAAAKKLADLQDRLFGRDLVEKAKLYAEALGSVDNVSKLMPAAQIELNKVFGAAYDALVQAGKGASSAAVEFDRLRLATTNWAAINAQIAAMPDPFAANTAKRRQAMLDTEVGIMNQNTALNTNSEYWMHAGEIADAEMAKAKAAVETVGPAATASAGQMQSAFSASFQSVGSEAESMAQRIAGVLQLAADNQANSHLFGGNFGTADAINRIAAQNVGRTIPQFASGGPVTRDGPIMAHAGEYVLPKGSTNGVTVNVGGISIVTSGTNAASDGRAAAEALLARLKQAGIRI